jgi:hypothetical protein
MTVKIKRRRKPFDIEAYRIKLLMAVDALDPKCELNLNQVNGTVHINGEDVFPKEVIYARDIEKLIDKRRFYLSMSKDARAIVNFICLSENSVLERLCGTTVRKRITASSIAKYFRSKWGKERVGAAIKEIRNLLKI